MVEVKREEEKRISSFVSSQVRLSFPIFVFIFLLELRCSSWKCRWVNLPVVVQQLHSKCLECSKVFLLCFDLVFSFWKTFRWGLGWATAINSFLVSIYYNMIIAWCLFYFFASFRRRLPWGDCGNWWNTERCVNPGEIFFFSFEITSIRLFYLEILFTLNSTRFCKGLQFQTNCTMPSLPPEEYFE